MKNPTNRQINPTDRRFQQTDRQTNRQTDRFIGSKSSKSFIISKSFKKLKKIQQTDRQTDRQTNRQSDRQNFRKIKKYANNETMLKKIKKEIKNVKVH